MAVSSVLRALLFSAVFAISGSTAPLVQAEAGDWELTSFPGAARELVVSITGELHAISTDGHAFSSVDLGDTWQPLGVPPGEDSRVLTVDPSSPMTLYGASRSGTYRSIDAGSTWQLVTSTADRVIAIEVSPADPNVLYQATLGSALRFFRSRDQGASWQALDVVDASASPCSLGLAVLQAHPGDPQRIFRAAECYAGRTLGSNLRQSRDQGTTWEDLFVGRGRGFHPSRIVGGAGALPARLYLSTSFIAPPGQGTLFRSDDDGATWQLILTSTEAGLGGLAYDPNQPERLYVGAGQTSAFFSLGTGVKTSADGGASWRDLGRQDLGPINDLKVAADGSALFAATAAGVWRLSFGPGGPDEVPSPRPPKA